MLKITLYIGITLLFCITCLYARTATPLPASDGPSTPSYGITTWQNSHGISLNSSDQNNNYIQAIDVNFSINKFIRYSWNTPQGWTQVVNSTGADIFVSDMEKVFEGDSALYDYTFRLLSIRASDRLTNTEAGVKFTI